MAYGSSYFPTSYQGYYAAPQQVQPQNSGIIWVQGEASAKSYPVAPNATVQLWDSEAQTIYLKSADASGMPSMKVIDYTIRDNQTNQPQVSVKEAYATRSDIDILNKRMDELEVVISKTKKRKEDAE